MNQAPADKTGFLETLAQIVDQAERFLTKASETGNREYDSALTKAADKLRSAQADFINVEESALRRARQAARATDDVVHEHPYASIGVAAAVGLLIGVLLSRR